VVVREILSLFILAWTAFSVLNEMKEKGLLALWPNRYSLHRFPYESFETPNDHENLIRFPRKDFAGLDFKADSLNLLR
jgi:hypothetical protein